LLGGGQTNYLFLKENMVDDLFLTIEPKMFGAGKHLNICKKLDIQLQLVSCKVLNKTGTLLLHYTVKKQE
ncbi:MAG: dihydrofolate reductase family protein, partial [Alphaproteobacteria bacterium]|nr:dihydrofolate reductase family protein [Alphaproteobacteria bacterium]